MLDLTKHKPGPAERPKDCGDFGIVNPALKGLRFGYIPYQPGARSPGDRRRFPKIAGELGLQWEIYQEGSQYDVVFITSNGDLTRFARTPHGGPKLVFEMVDSYLKVDWLDFRGMVRGIGKWVRKQHSHLELSFAATVRKIAQRADLVICSTPEQQNDYCKVNPNSHPILDLHDELSSGLTAPSTSETKIHLFWEGVGITSREFSTIASVLKDVAQEWPLCLHLVTDLSYRPLNLPWPVFDTKKQLEQVLNGLEFYLYEWNPVAVSAIASHCHLGLIPLNLGNSLLNAKPENKLLIMWRLGLPVITSATPAYVRTMKKYGGPEWTCETSNDWEKSLRAALGDQESRDLARTCGLRYVTETVSADKLRLQWVQALETLL